MAWVNMDDRFPEHRKNASLSDAAFRLHVAGICWCNRELTDGVVEADQVPILVRRFRKPALAELLSTGQWVQLPDGSYLIHDYLDWNPSRETVIRRREAAAKRQGRWRGKNAGGNAS